MTAPAETGHCRAADHLADQAATCPKCGAAFAWPCQSTGGGNYTGRPTHQARKDRTAHWTKEQRQRYGQMVLGHRRRGWDPASTATDEQIAEAEAAAAPIPTRATNRPTPKGVRLSPNQAEWIERAAENGGNTSCSTAHFHGDADRRKSVLALRDKGIFAEGELFNDGYDRRYTLTEYGWKVWANHRLIIRREPAVTRWAALNIQERR